MFDRFQICLGYWHYALAYNGSREAAEIFARLDRMHFMPATSEEYWAILEEPGYEVARQTYENLGGEFHPDTYGEEL